MLKILTIVGARPQFIKAGSLSREIAKYKNITECLVHTGQHYDKNMSDVFFRQMQIKKPDYNLKIQEKTHGTMTGEMIKQIEKVAIKEKPDFVVVYGDTNSTLAGAIVASKLQIKLVHIEAGLRSYNKKMPEEINRILTDRISDILFCPTDIAVDNLKKEGFDNFPCKIIKSGDVMFDGVLFYQKLAKKPDIDVPKKYVLATVHRAENTDDRGKLESILSALDTISKTTPVILSLHPRTRKIITKLQIKISNIKIIKPVGYLQMIWLISNCSQVMTDSGGLQKEAYFFQKPCVTLRDETEWQELVNIKVNIIVGSDREKIIQSYKNNKNKKITGLDKELYGRGDSGNIIIKSLLAE
jgi:UDP-GlcNAc3NAcA epimerase